MDYYGKAGLDESGMKFKKIAFTKTYRGDEGRSRGGKKGGKSRGNFKNKNFKNRKRGR